MVDEPQSGREGLTLYALMRQGIRDPRTVYCAGSNFYETSASL